MLLAAPGFENAMLLDEAEYNHIWDWVEKVLHFRPNCRQGHDLSLMPFKIPVKHIAYCIDSMTNCQADVMDDLIDQAILNVTTEGQRIYALDWNHECYLYDPRKLRHFPRRPYFLEYYPDGDYYFYIDEFKQFGYLSHPWRREVWIFGDPLLNEFKKIYSQLGWTILLES